MKSDLKTYRSKVLFECKDGASLYSIPCTDTLSTIKFTERNKIWQGSLLFIEEEQLSNSYMEGFEQTKNDKFIIHPFLKMKSKLEFRNGRYLWGETWYCPVVEDLNLSTTTATNVDVQKVTKISHDGTNTIEQISSNKFKVIVQLPNSGYKPYYPNHSPDDLPQVALGLEFENPDMAAQFEYMLAVYDARFKYELQLYYYDRMVYAVNIINFKTIMQEQEEEEEEDIHELTEEFKNQNITDEFSYYEKTSKELEEFEKENANKFDHDTNDDDDGNDDEDDDFGDFIAC